MTTQSEDSIASVEDLTVGAAALESLSHMLRTGGRTMAAMLGKAAKTAGIDISRLPDPHLDIAARLDRVAMFLRAERLRREI